MSQSYKELEIYKLSFELAVKVHEMSMTLPRFEMYEEGSQIRRSAKSVVSNIVEGFGRPRYKDELGKKLTRFIQAVEFGHLVPQKRSSIQHSVSSIVVLLFVLLSSIQHPVSSFAAFSSRSAGTSGAAFLKLGAGARPAALGEAYTGVADDVNAIYWNTAGLASLKKNEFVAMRADLFQDMQYHFFAFAHPTKRWGTFALGINNLNVSGIEQRSEDTDKPETTFAANDSAYTLGYGLNLPELPILGEGLKIGGGAKFIRQTLAGFSANGVAIDIGSLYHFRALPLSLGLSVQNLGAGLKFKDATDPIPLTIKVGGSYRLGESWAISGKSSETRVGSLESEEEKKVGGLLLSLDLNVPRDNNPSLRFGSEFTRIFGDNFSASLRGATFQLAKSGDGATVSGIGGAFGLSAGMGVTWRFLTFDFAWKPFKELGDTYRYSVKLKF